MIFHNYVILLDDISHRFCVKCIPIPSPFMMTGMECQKWLCEDIWDEAKSNQTQGKKGLDKHLLLGQNCVSTTHPAFICSLSFWRGTCFRVLDENCRGPKSQGLLPLMVPPILMDYDHFI